MSLSAVVGLDLSLTETGFAVYTPSRPPLTGTLRANLKGVQRLQWLRDQVVALLPGRDAPDLVSVYIEGYSFASRNSQAHALGELGGVVRVGIEEAGYSYLDVPPSSLKKLATGRGNAGKEEVLAAAIRRLGYERHNNNEADALWLAQFGLHLEGVDWPTRADLPKNHLVALDKFL